MSAKIVKQVEVSLLSVSVCVRACVRECAKLKAFLLIV